MKIMYTFIAPIIVEPHTQAWKEEEKGPGLGLYQSHKPDPGPIPRAGDEIHPALQNIIRGLVYETSLYEARVQYYTRDEAIALWLAPCI